MVEERDNLLHFVEELGPRLYYKFDDKYSDQIHETFALETNKIRNDHRIIGLYFSASWSEPCEIWGGIIRSLQKELNESIQDDKLLQCIIVPMSLKKDEEPAMKQMSYNQQMPMIPFEEAYAI